MDISKSARSTLILLFFIIAVHVMGQSGNQLIRIHTVSNVSSLGSITNALEGNLIYVESTDTIYYYDGSNWVNLSSTSSSSSTNWEVVGNTATSSDFLGTTNNTDLDIRTNNIQKMTVKNNGRVGIGTDNPSGIFEVSTQGTNHNLIPPMVSDTVNNISVSVNFHTGHTTSLTNSAFHIFDNSTSTSITSSVTSPFTSSTSIPGFWISVDFQNANYIVNSYDFRVNSNQPQNSPNEFKLEGSNDGNTCVSLENLHTIPEITYQWNPLQSFNISNTTPNRYYKFHIYKMNSNFITGDATVGECELIELNLYGVSSDFIINNSGNVGIGVQDPSEKLQVNGNILATGTIVPDYVFEHYFEGKSKLNPEYTFTDLEETIEFTKKNHHLPGIPSAKKIEKQGGILINRAVEQNLEKIEELYLHLYELHQKKDSLKTVLQQKINQKEKVNVKQRIKPIEAVLEE